MTTAFVIGRRRKGRKIGAVVRETRKRLEAVGWTAESKLVDRKREMRREVGRAVKAKVDIVVAVGGDGAVLQAIQKLAETDVALGIIPMGTGNLLAGNLRIPKRPDRAADVIIGGVQRRIDLGSATIDGKDEWFAVACGVGFDAEVMQATAKQQKLRWGKLAYLASAFQQRKHVRNVVHELTIDGVASTMEATQVFIANFGRMGMAMAPRLKIHPDDGQLDVIVVQASGAIPGLLAGWEAIRQRHHGRSSKGHVFRTKAREVEVTTEPSRLVETDGSVMGTTPIRVSVRPSALTVMVPADR